MSGPASHTATMLPLTSLVGHTGNIRRDLGDLTELAQSIRVHGLLQPIVVTPHPKRSGRWLILAGHRRAAACGRVAGLQQVPAIIRRGVDDETLQLTLMLVENHQRRDLTPVEKAEALGALRNRGLNQSEIARTTGMHVTHVNALLALLDLDDDSLDDVRDGSVTAGDAIAAVRATRARTRRQAGTPQRGRPVVVQVQHFGPKHPLADHVRGRCGHTTITKVGGIGCGDCWEAVIRDDALGALDPRGGGVPDERHTFDEVAVTRALDGDRSVNLTIRDRAEIVRRGNARGWSDRLIADRTGMTDRSVHRIRQRHGIAAVDVQNQVHRGVL